MVYMLNQDSKPEVSNPLRELIVLCVRLQEAAARMNFSTGGGLKEAIKFSSSLKESPEFAEIRSLQADLNIRLQEFQSTPVIELQPSTRPGIAPRLISYQVLPRHIALLWSEDYYPGEYHPFYALLDAIEDGTLANVKACICGKYFFKKFAHQRFCSEECRIKENQTSEKARESRRRWQRDNYQAHKALESGSRVTTGLKKPKNVK